MTTLAFTIRDARPGDLDDIVDLDRRRTGVEKRGWWDGIRRAYGQRDDHVALVAELATGGVVGFLFGEVRAFEFGSPPCGWIYSVAVDPAREREGVASTLCTVALERFRRFGVDRVRTMVRRDDIAVLSFFRSMEFNAGPYTQLELDLEEKAS